MKINYIQLPVKIHYFFFMGAMGPILPFLPVYGKQLGVSPLVMGSITAVLPILFLIAKPIFGFLVDYFYNWRKSIFVALLTLTSGCYICIYFVPAISNEVSINYNDISCSSLYDCEFYDATILNCVKKKNATCRWICDNENDNSSFVRMNTEESSNAFCFIDVTKVNNCVINNNNNNNCTKTSLVLEDNYNLYISMTFWSFVLLMSLGNIGFNISNCISDAICFDVLGEGGQMGYGRQRVWGTIGFGISAFLAGYAVDLWSEGKTIKTYTPAFILVFIFTSVDLLCCTKLKLPIMSGSTNIMKDVYNLLKSKPIFIFLCFATLAGILDSFMIYFLFWYLEDLSKATGYMYKIKLIEGLIVAAQTLGGEVIFFSLSDSYDFIGKILKKIGYGYSFAFCLLCYAIRLTLISLASTPWWVVLIEFFMQGPTYALCYTTIVAYASAVSPPGTSATVQGIVAGMDDGLGYAIGSLFGGILYKEMGGVITLQIFAAIAMLSALIYIFLHITYLKHTTPDTRKEIEWKSPEDANMECIVAEK
ncbi:major facilitator superfamily domain-containing protein 6 isoform X1 [Vespa velutina]|uniref:major facilitator superfamily domain-containing protein 6 isoform X1 n=2 Tax=Vespa velutina TaxID=202808 RepID=UPI001FB46C2B|nr:major facilitator superfamily domain-containing protein 6 isoform X1 [Vespa velutina]XP_047365967.1 major facilitator superfamily domain-containing protein 6 isoform X1 [Vespa velutina]XP_047365968.1 major facilitator superfamily domain-containing protein 6 isoform X1 [Vespa velutina]